MNKNNELLNYIHQNSEMGKDTINQLLNISKDENFCEELRRQLKEYSIIYDSCNDLIERMSKEPKDISDFAKVSAYISINMKTIMDKSSSHIAEMMIQGSTMGIIDITKRLKDYDPKDDEIAQLGDKLLKVEQNNVETLKKFL